MHTLGYLYACLRNAYGTKRYNGGPSSISSFSPKFSYATHTFYHTLLIRFIIRCSVTAPLHWYLSYPQNPGVKIVPTVVPVIKSLIRAPDYNAFKTVIRRELTQTLGWEDVSCIHIT